MFLVRDYRFRKPSFIAGGASGKILGLSGGWSFGGWRFRWRSFGDWRFRRRGFGGWCFRRRGFGSWRFRRRSFGDWRFRRHG